MKKYSAFIFLTMAIIFCGSVGVNAQSNLTGKYHFDEKIDEGRNTLRLVFEFKDKKQAVYSNEQGGNETQRRAGTWAYSAKTKRITAVFPPVKGNPVMGQEVKLTFVFAIDGKNLKLVSDLPYKQNTGAVFQKSE